MFSFFKKLFGPGTDYKLLVQNGAVIIDVRSPQEFDNGHIKGSKNIPVNIIQRELNTIKKMGKPIITVCQSGARSGMAKGILKSAGIEVYNGGSWFGLRSKIK
jgi:rhodanese-related sulfurtransferase